MHYDVIVIGGGPSGSTTAREVATAGAKTLLIDRARFPRDKPCGGGVNLRAATLLPFDLSPVTERVIYSARFSLRYETPTVHHYSKPLAYMTQRRRLDAFLLERAAETGVIVHDGERARAVEMNGRDVTVRTDAGIYTTSALVGADGANGIVATSAGVGVHIDWAAALEGNLPWDEAIHQQWTDRVALDLDTVDGGYGWVFPKGDHLNFGVGGWSDTAGPHLRDELAVMCRHYGVTMDALWGLRGHRLPLRRPGTPITKGPVVLVGDAAGCVDPLTGDGIHGAITSGRLAASAIRRYLAGKDADLTLYQRLIDRYLMPDLITSRQLKAAFHHRPGPYYAMLRHSRLFWTLFCRIMTGDTSYVQLKRRLRPLSYLLDVLAAFAS